jgi:TPR repeat protein
MLGLRYDRGQGIPESDLEATRWYQIAADAGIPDAKYHLGVLFERGESVPQNEAMAASFYREAAEQGLDWAAFALGQLHRKGIGVDFDEVLAYAWLNIAAGEGNGTAANERNQMRVKLSREQIALAQDLSLKLLKVTADQGLQNRLRFAPPGQRRPGGWMTGTLEPSERTREMLDNSRDRRGSGSSRSSGRGRSTRSGS